MTITNPEPPFPPSAHDPDTRDKWGRDFTPQLGRAITTVTGTVVDANDVPIAGTDLIIDTVAWALTDAATNRWTVTFWLSGGTAGAVYRIRLRFFLDSDVIPSADSTVQIGVLQN